MFRATVTVNEDQLTDREFMSQFRSGQHVALHGTRGRFMGFTPHGTVYVLWGKQTGERLRRMSKALRGRK